MVDNAAAASVNDAFGSKTMVPWNALLQSLFNKRKILISLAFEQIFVALLRSKIT
jgi:hypothetical protein